MEHIRQFDWCTTEPDISFLSETDIDNCVTEKILRNKFHDPLVRSESEDEDEPKLKLNWDEIFNKKKIDRKFRMVVQGIHPVPPFTKLSALTSAQHYQCLKVLSSLYPDVLPEEKIPRPTKHDFRVFELVKDLYEKEQKEFIDWAKSLWVSDHCVRALRPKPPIEMVYEAEFKVRSNSLASFPKNYDLAAQIPLEPTNATCELVHQKDIIKVAVTSLPQMQQPDMTKKITIMKPCPVPEPCNKHPCRFILPTESSMTILPLTETHRELAQFASDNGATAIASESALRCLVQDGSFWTVPVSVCQVITVDGDSSNVVVLGSEFSLHREPARVRTYKAFRRLLENALVPPLEVHLANQRREAANDKKCGNTDKSDDGDSDDENDKLVIDTDEVDDVDMQDETGQEEVISPRKSERKAKENSNKIGFYNCTCKETPFSMPAARSYRAWRVRNAAGDSYDFIAHCAHRLRNESGEVILEPIPEYQLELGGSAAGPDAVRRAALALTLRREATVLNGEAKVILTPYPEYQLELGGSAAGPDAVRRAALALTLRREATVLNGEAKVILTPYPEYQLELGGSAAGPDAALALTLKREATVLNVRIDSASGDIVTLEDVPADVTRPVIGDVSRRLYAAMDQLRGLLPGHYLLRHEPGHGSNALLWRARGGGHLALAFDCSQLAEADEAKSVKAPPTIAPVLLPVHKFRKYLPCAFTPHRTQLAREPRRPPHKQKQPPQAIKWPTKKKRKRKNRNNNNL